MNTWLRTKLIGGQDFVPNLGLPRTQESAIDNRQSEIATQTARYRNLPVRKRTPEPSASRWFPVL